VGLAFAPDGRSLVSGCDGGVVKVWDPDAGKQRAGSGPAAAVRALALAPDGRTFATGDSSGHVRLWDPAGCKVLAELSREKHAICSLSFSPDGATLAAGNASNEVEFWDVRRRRWFRYASVSGPIEGVAYSPDGKVLAAAAPSKRVWLWDPVRWTGRSPFGQPLRPVGALAFSADGRTLFTGSSAGGLAEWGTRSEYVRQRAGFLWDRVISGDADDIRLWDYTSRTELPGLPGQQTFGVFSLATSRDGRTLAAGGLGGAVWVWDVQARRAAAPLFLSPEAGSLWQSWEWADRLGIPMLPEFTERIRQVALAPNGGLLAAAGETGTVKLWELPGGRERAAFRFRPGTPPCLAFSPDGGTLAVSEGGRVHLHDPADGSRRQTLPLNRHAIHCLAFSPDGRLLTSAGEDREIKLWDLAAGRQRANLIGHKEMVSSLAFTPDGRTLASGSWDHTVRLWHLPTGQELALLDEQDIRIRAVAFSPDGKVLASAGEALVQGVGDLRLWQVGP
jgi:WD40 repeat protein